MRKLATILSVFGFIAFAGLAHADDKTEKSVKTDTSTTLGGQKKTTKVEKTKNADGSSTETKTEVVAPKRDEAAKRDEVKRDGDVKRDADANRDVKTRHEVGGAEVTEKSDTSTTLTGKKQTTKTKKVVNPDGSKVETKTTTESAK
ncbi:MAG: hypothetical protein JWN44_1317 [Myxococcales bacterium]|nr:hypothetical protein [Myxococcales bacterium]